MPCRRCPCALIESLITTLEGLGYKVDLQTITVADATIALQVGGAKPQLWHPAH